MSAPFLDHLHTALSLFASTLAQCVQTEDDNASFMSPQHGKHG